MADIYGRMYAFHSNMVDSFKTLSLWATKRCALLSDHVRAINFPVARYCYLCEKDFEKSLEYYDKAFEGDVQNSYYLMNAHASLRRMGRWEEAYEYMHRLVELEPRWVSAKTDLAMDCWCMRKYAETVHWLRESIRQDPGQYTSYLDLASVLVAWKGDIFAARKVMEESYDLIDSTRWKGHRLWWDMLERNLSTVRSYLSIPYYDSATYYTRMADVWRVVGDSELVQAYTDSSLVFARRLAEEYPDWHGSRIALATEYRRLGRTEAAIGEGLKAMKLMPLSRDAIMGADVLDEMVWICNGVGEIDMALDYLDTVMTIPSTLGLGNLIVNPDYDDLVRTDRFKQVMEEYADTAQWRIYGEVLGPGN